MNKTRKLTIISMSILLLVSISSSIVACLGLLKYKKIINAPEYIDEAIKSIQKAYELLKMYNLYLNLTKYTLICSLVISLIFTIIIIKTKSNKNK